MRQVNEYKAVVRSLAREIAEQVNRYWVEPMAPENFSELRNVFEEGNRRPR